MRKSTINAHCHLVVAASPFLHAHIASQIRRHRALLSPSLRLNPSISIPTISSYQAGRAKPAFSFQSLSETVPQSRYGADNLRLSTIILNFCVSSRGKLRAVTRHHSCAQSSKCYHVITVAAPKPTSEATLLKLRCFSNVPVLQRLLHTLCWQHEQCLKHTFSP